LAITVKVTKEDNVIKKMMKNLKNKKGDKKMFEKIRRMLKDENGMGLLFGYGMPYYVEMFDTCARYGCGVAPCAVWCGK